MCFQMSLHVIESMERFVAYGALVSFLAGMYVEVTGTTALVGYDGCAHLTPKYEINLIYEKT